MLFNLSFLPIVMVTGAFCVLFTNLLKEMIIALTPSRSIIEDNPKNIDDLPERLPRNL